MHVQPPVLAATLHQLREGQKAHEYKNATVPKKKVGDKSKKTQPPQDIVGLLSGHDGRYVNGRGPAQTQTPGTHKRVAAGSEARSVSGNKGGARVKETKADAESQKLATRMLKFSQATGGFHFPRRERFNEAVDDEIQSQMSDQK